MGTISTIDTIVNAVPRLGAGIGQKFGGEPGKYVGASVGYLIELGVIGTMPFIGGIAATVVAVASPIVYFVNKEDKGETQG